MRPRSLTLCASLALAACGSGPESAEEVELSNIRPGNIIPRSSPKQLVDTFKRVCMAPSLAAAQEALRGLDYAKARSRGAAETYFVDNNRPAVALQPSAGGFDCLVQAQARTGQASAVEDFMAKTFPQATPRSQDGFERFWITPYANGGNIFTQRSGTRPRAPRTYTFGISRPVPLNHSAQASRPQE